MYTNTENILERCIYTEKKRKKKTLQPYFRAP